MIWILNVGVIVEKVINKNLSVGHLQYDRFKQNLILLKIMKKNLYQLLVILISYFPDKYQLLKLQV